MNLTRLFNVDMGWAPQRVDSNVFESQVTMYNNLAVRNGNVITQRSDGTWEFTASPDLTAASPADYWMVVRAGEKDNDATGLNIAVKTPMLVTIDFEAANFTVGPGYGIGTYLTSTATGQLRPAINKDQIIAKVYADLRPAKNALTVEWIGGTGRMF